MTLQYFFLSSLDCPCIVSGHKILLIDPLRKNPEKICQFIDLKKLKRKRRFENFSRDCLRALNNTFSFSEETLESGTYKGTMFWFPLRIQKSDLSDNICGSSQVKSLFNAFKEDSNWSLLFLKSLCKVEMFIRQVGQDEKVPTLKSPKRKKRKLEPMAAEMECSDRTDMCLRDKQPFYWVAINTDKGDLVQRRKNFLQRIGNGDRELTEELGMKVRITTFSSMTGKEEKYDWYLVNYLPGMGQMSTQLKSLKADKDICSLPLVGLAAPLLKVGQYTNDDGHVFCYQPLPKESKHVTGLPVHVNAFFVLSQNRRHIKWPDVDKEGMLDKGMEWNQRLVKEIFPKAYARLIDHLVNLAKEAKNSKDLLHAVYYSIPSLNKVESRWRTLAEKTILELQTRQCLLTLSSEWISPKQSILVDETKYPELSTTVWKTVKSFVKKELESIVCTEEHINQSLEEMLNRSLRFLTPGDIHKVMLKSVRYKSLSKDKKLDILEFLTYGENYDLLDTLELLPLADGSFTDFQNKGKSSFVFLEDQDIVNLFPGQQSLFVAPDEMSLKLLKNIRKSGRYFCSEI